MMIHCKNDLGVSLGSIYSWRLLMGLRIVGCVRAEMSTAVDWVNVAHKLRLLSSTTVSQLDR